MATLILSVAGQIIGGPIGSTIGSIIGQQIDAEIFKPRARHGPRLKELDVQTSSYGSAIPAIFGAMRVAGTVIWASDLIERRSKSGGGKGRPSTINYSYSVNMAVALSSKPIKCVGRIWADGNLIRGAAGDWKVETEFRLYAGERDQIADPLIASAEGACPAFRGLAYAVFEDMQLADFGNRIPSMTFELFERDGAVRIVDIAGKVSDGLITGSCVEQVDGYALTGNDARSALAPLLEIMPVNLASTSTSTSTSTGLVLEPWWVPGPALVADAVTRAGETRLETPSLKQSPGSALPRSLTIRHYEPARDYQLGVQRAERGHGRKDSQADLPAALAADRALRLADLVLLGAQRGSGHLTGYFALSDEAIHAGSKLRFDGRDWRVIEVEHGRGCMKVTAQSFLDAEPGVPAIAAPGSHISSPDLAVGQTVLMLLDLPAPSVSDPGKPLVGVLAAGTQPGWRRAALSLVQGASLVELGQSAGPAVMGGLREPLAAHPATLIDEDHLVELACLHDAMELPPGTGDPLSSTAPLICLGGEYIRYGSAEYLGDGNYRARRLLRGCFDDDGGGAHLVGRQWALVDPSSVALVEDVPIAIGCDMSVQALGLGDDEPAHAMIDNVGRAVRPLAPVHGTIDYLGEGGVALSWIRRSRLDGGWHDGVEQLLGEDGEHYSVKISQDDVLRAATTVTEPRLVLNAGQWAEISASASPLVCSIRQIGRFAPSGSLSLMIEAAG